MQSLALRALRKRKPQETLALALASSQSWLPLLRPSIRIGWRLPIRMLGRSSGNHDWLLANASASVSCGFRLRNARNASDCVWMETGLETVVKSWNKFSMIDNKVQGQTCFCETKTVFMRTKCTNVSVGEKKKKHEIRKWKFAVIVMFLLFCHVVSVCIHFERQSLNSIQTLKYTNFLN